jgi:copper(I)-binding protein
VRRALLALLVGAWALTGCGDDDDPADGDAADVVVSDAWARSTAAAQTTGAVYFDVESSADDTLVSASVPASIAAAAELHEHVMNDDGSMVMRELDDGLVLEAGEPAAFEPGGLHVMLVDLAAPLEVGQSFELTLDFANADPVVVPVTVYETEP